MSGIQSIRNGLTGNITKIIVVAIIITFIGSVGWAGFFSQGSANIIAKVTSAAERGANKVSIIIPCILPIMNEEDE